MKQEIDIKKLIPNENNPRYIRDAKFKKLVKSIKEFPEMMEKRPIVVDESMIVLGGNMRLKACEEAGLKKVWIDIAEGWSEKKKREFIIKDNVGYGEWEYDILANEWDSEQLADWGMDLPDSWDVEDKILDTEDIKEEDEYLAIVVVAFDDINDLDKITSFYELDSIDIPENVKSQVVMQRKAYVFKK